MTKDLTAEQLDELKVIEDDQVLCCVGLLVTLYFRDGHTREKREALWRCHERYWETAGAHLRWGSHPGTGRPVELSKKKLPPLREWLDQLPEEDELDVSYHGGRHKDDADAYSLSLYTSRLNPDKLSFFSATLPFSWVAQNPAGSFVRLVRDFCEYLQPFHGYGGMAAISHVSHSKARESRRELSVYALARRFPGLEVDYPVSHLRHLGKGIKGVNWLTVLSEARSAGGQGISARAPRRTLRLPRLYRRYPHSSRATSPTRGCQPAQHPCALSKAFPATQAHPGCLPRRASG
jgi:hypothetical protein